MKEQTLEGFKNKYGLSGLYSQPTVYIKFEDKTEEVFKDVELLIAQTREETIKEIEEKLPLYDDEERTNIMSQFGWNNALRKTKKILNKLKK